MTAESRSKTIGPWMPGRDFQGNEIPERKGLVSSTFNRSGRAGKNAAQEVTLGTQRFAIPGQQSYQKRVAELQAEGIKRSDAINDAWEETDLNLPRVHVPGNEDIGFTLNAQSVIEVGFDPLDLVLAFATAGQSKTVTLGARASIFAISKATVRETMFGYAGRGVLGAARLGSQVSFGTVRATSPTKAAKFKRAIKGLDIPDEIAEQIQQGPLRRNPLTGQFSAPLSQDEVIGMYDRAYRANRRSGSSGIGQIKSTSDLEKAAFRTDAKSQASRKAGNAWLIGPVINRLHGAIDPAAIAKTAAEKGLVIYSQVGAIGQKYSGLARDFVLDGGNPRRVFNIRGNRAHVDNVTLSHRGRLQYQSSPAISSTSQGQSVGVQGVEQRGPFTFGDIMERWEDPSGPKAHLSWFDGLTNEQADTILRIRKAQSDMIATMVKEGVITQGQVDVWEQAGREGFNYVSRRTAGKEIEFADGVRLLEYGGQAGGTGGSHGTAFFLESRVFETMEDAAREGVHYSDPLEAMDAFIKAGYGQIAEKRTLAYIESKGVMVNTKDALRKIQPQLFARQKAANRVFNSTSQNLGRLRKKVVGDRRAQPILNAAARKADRELDRSAVALDKMTERTEDLAVEVAKWGGAHRHANGVLGRTKSKAARKKWTAEAKRTKNMMDRRTTQLTEHSREYTDSARDYARRLDERSKSLGKASKGHDGKPWSTTDDAEQAQREYNGARKEVAAARNDINDEAKKLARDRSAPEYIFPAHANSAGNIKIELGRVNLGGYSGKLLVKDAADALNKRFGDRGSNLARRIGLVTGSARTVGAGFDVGVQFIQGQSIMFTRPQVWAKATAKSLEAIANPEARAKYVVDNMEDFVNFAENGGDIGSSEMFQSLDSAGGLGRLQGWMRSKTADGSIPENALEIWGNHAAPLGRLGTGFNSFLDVGKLEMWKSMRGTVDDGVVSQRELASYINNSLGTLNTSMLGVSPRQSQVESGVLFFSPRFTRSAFALVGNAMGSGKVARDAQRNIAGLLIGATATMYGISKALGQEPNINPFAPGYLTVDIGGSNVGVGGAGRALYDMAFKVFATANPYQDGNALDLAKFNVFDPTHRRDNPIMQYWLNRAAPGVRELLTQETFDGQPIDSLGPVPNPFSLNTLKVYGSKSLPFVLQSQVDERAGVPRPGLRSSLLQSLGMRERPLNAYERMEITRDKAANNWIDPDTKESGFKWDELPLDAQQEIRDDSEWSDELQIREDAFQDNTNGDSKPYFDDIDKERETYNTAMSSVWKEYGLKTNGPALRRKIHDVQTVRAATRDARQNDPEYADTIAKLSEPKGDIPQFNFLVNEYVAAVIENPELLDEYGNYNYDVREASVEAFKDRDDVDEDLFYRIDNYVRGRNRDGTQRKTLDYPEQKEYWDYQDGELALKPYWQVADNLLEDHPEILQLYKDFQSYNGDPNQQAAMKRAYPVLKGVDRMISGTRKNMRQRDPSIDLHLVKFHGHRAAARENIGYEVSRQQAILDTALASR